MNWNNLNILLSIAIISLLVACVPSEQVVSNHFFTKRKYTKGWYVNTPVNEKKYSYRHTQTEEEKTENNIIEDTQLNIEYAQTGEQMPLIEKKLPDKTYTPKTPTPKTQTDTIPAKKKAKKNFFSRIKEVDAEGKKTNPYALASIVAIVWSLIMLPFLIAMSNNSLMLTGSFGRILSYVFASFFPALLVGVLAAFLAFIEKRKHPGVYKENGLAIPGVALGISAGLTALGFFLYFLIYSDIASDLMMLILLGYITIMPFVVIAIFFYMAFIKNYHKAKKVYTKEGIEKKQSNLKKLGRWGLILMAVGFILGLGLVVFAEAFLVLLPNSLDFYLFLFACAVFFSGLILKLISKRVFAKKNVNP